MRQVIGSKREAAAAQFMAFAALLLTIVGARVVARPPAFPARVDAASWWIVVPGVLLLWAGLALARLPRLDTDGAKLSAEIATNGRHRLRTAAIGAAIFGMLAQVEINGNFLGLAQRYPVPPHVQLMLLVLSCALFIWGFSGGRASRAAARGSAWRTWAEPAAVAALTAVALALRLYNLEALRAFVDEGNFLLPVTVVPNEPYLRLLMPFSSGIAFPYLYPYLQWLAGGLTESGLVALRIPSAVFGALTVPALYLLARQVFDRPTALVAAGLLAALPVHVQWSRLGMNNAADPLFGVLTLALLARGVKRGGRWHFAAAGVCLGVTQYFYESGRLFFPVLTVVWGAFVLVAPRWRPARRDVLAFLFTAFWVALPIYTTLLAMQYPIAVRFRETRAADILSPVDAPNQVHPVLDRLHEALIFFVSTPEIGRALFYGGDLPYLHPYLLPLLLLGLGVVAWRWRTPGGSLTLLWIGGVVGAVAVLMNGMNSARVLLVFPAVAMLCAAGAVDTFRLLTRDRARAALALCAAATLAIGALHTTYYFGIHIDRFLQQHYREQPEQELVFHARTLPDGIRTVYVTTREVRQSALDQFVRALQPGVRIEIVRIVNEPTTLDDVRFSPETIVYLEQSDSVALYRLMERFELRGPLRWPQPYVPPGVEYVAYFVADAREPAPANDADDPD